MNFQLLPLSSSEAHIAILVSDVTFAQKLRGILTYIIQGFNNTIHEKLDFILHLPCSTFIIDRISHGDILIELLKSDQLLYKLRNEITACKDFSSVLKNICSSCHLMLVEYIDESASLFGQSLKGHHVCLLIKQNVS
jgi:AP-3 complex subunit delta-1